MAHRVLPLLLVFALVSSSLARAAQTEGIQKQIFEVARLYEALEYEDALALIRRARSMPHAENEEVSLLLYEGILWLEKGKSPQGRAAFVSALQLDRDARLPVPVAPKIETVFDSARNQVRRKSSNPIATKGSRGEDNAQGGDVPRREASAPSAPEVEAQAVPVPVPKARGETPTGVSLRRHALLPALAGGALVVAGGVCWAFSRQELGRLRGEPSVYTTFEEAREGAARGRAWQTAGVTLLGAGLVGLSAAAGMYVFGGPRRTIALGVGPRGASAFVGGEWP